MAIASLALALAAATPARADVPVSEEARSHFSAGVLLLKDPTGPRYEEAYREFNAAFRASPSPKILGNLGLCAMKLERDAEAIDAYERYLDEARDQTKEEREQIKKDLVTLRAGLVRIRLSSIPPGATIEDTRTASFGGVVHNTYGPLRQKTSIGVRQGKHVMIAKLEGYADQKWEFESGGSDLGEHVFTLEKVEKKPKEEPQSETAAAAPATTRPVPTAVYVGAGVTAALAIGATIAGASALAHRDEYDEANRRRDFEQAQDLQRDGERLNIFTDVLVGATIAAAAVTVVLYVTRSERKATGAASGNFGAGSARLGWTF
jgi:hypothetical protein